MPKFGLRFPEQYGSKLPVIRYSLAVAMTVVAFLWRQEMVRQFGSELPPFITFYPTVMIVAILAGFWPGVLATLVAVAIAIYWIIPPHAGLGVGESRDVFGMVVFAVMGLVMSLVAGLYRKARETSSAYEKGMALLEQHEFNRQIIASANEGIIVLDRQLRYQTWNPFLERCTGISAHNLLGKQPGVVLSEFPELKELTDGLQRALGGEAVSLPDLRLDLPHGTGKSWFSVTTNPLRNLRGQVIGVLAFLHDITARRQTEHHLRLSQASLSRAQAVAHVGSWFLDCTKNDLTWSDETYRIFRLPVGVPLTYEAFLERVHPDDREQVESAWKAGLRMGSYAIEHRIVTDHGTRWVSEKAEIEFNSGRVPQSAIGTVRDITERRQAHEALRKASLYTRSLIEASLDPLVTISHEGKITDVNQATEKATGVSRGLLIGSDFCEYFTEPDKARLGYQRAFEEGSVRDYPLAICHISGQVTDVLYNASVIRNEQGEIECVFAAARDITARKQAEEALRKAEERFEKAFRTSPLAFSISTEAEGRYLDANDAFLQLLGYERQQIIGSRAQELNLWAEPADRVELVRQLQQSGRVTGIHTRFKTFRGEIREVDVAAERIELDGLPCILAITQDVTEAKRLEAQFRQAQKMEAIGRLSGGIAHDFNNLLGIMMGYAELACGLVDPTHPAARHLAEIRNAGQRAIGLIRQLLAFSRRQVVFPRVLDLNAAVNDVAKMLSRVIGEDITLTLKLADSLASIKADEGQIEQILMNLAVNARDAMPKGGRLVIETANVELDESLLQRHPEGRPGAHVLLSVSDTGCGMDKDTLSHIFEPFFTTKGTGKGTGLGLSTVYGIVKQSNGYVWVYSEPGKGTTFRIYFPVVSEHADRPSETQPEAPQPAGRETILLVEDDEAFRALTASALGSAGYTVIATDGPAAAIKLVAERDRVIDLLLTDVIMPGMPGSELARRAQELRPGLRVLFMSGYAGDLLAQYGDIGSGQMVEKPFTKRLLLAKVDGILHPSERAQEILKA